MGEKRIVLKIGGRKHLGEVRWRGALALFDEVYCACMYREPSWKIENDHVKFLELPHTAVNQRLTGLLIRIKGYRCLSWLSCMAIGCLRVMNIDWFRKIKNISADRVWSSLSDYDWSDLMCVLTKPALTRPLVRAQKETRVGYNYLEHRALKVSNTIVLYDEELKKFLMRKYGESLFHQKKLIVGYDENALPSCILDGIRYAKKFSDGDGRIHAVILSYRVDSAPKRERDQGRYYYVDVIRKMVQCGLIVHLHCAEYNDDNGVNRYRELADAFPKAFFMEQPLNMSHYTDTEGWIQACEILSSYDVGLLHNIVEGSSVSEFDRINIPHRFYAYQAAHVAPFIERGSNVVLERMFAEKKCGLVIDRVEDLVNAKETVVKYYIPRYEEYLKAILEI